MLLLFKYLSVNIIPLSMSRKGDTNAPKDLLGCYT